MSELSGQPREALLATLRSGDDQERLAVVFELAMRGQRGDPGVIPPLIEALGYVGRYVNEASSDALVRLGAPAVAALLTLLWNQTAAAGPRFWAARTLVYMQDPRAVDPVLAILGDRSEDVEVRRLLPSYAARTEDERVPDLLRDLAHDSTEDLQVRLSAGSCIPELEQSVPEWSYEELLAMLPRAAGQIRYQVLNLIAQLGDHRSLDVFVPLMSSADISERMQASSGLMHLGDMAWEPLTTALRSEQSETRVAAVAGLVGCGPRAITLLRDRLEFDPSPGVRGYAAAVLGTIGGDEALVDDLLHASEHEDPEALVGIVNGLGHLRDPRVLPAIRRLGVGVSESTSECWMPVQWAIRQVIRRLEALERGDPGAF